MNVAEAQDKQADEHFGDDQAHRPGLVIDAGDDHFGQPFMVDPSLTAGAVRVIIGPGDRTGPEDVLAETDVSEEVGVGDGVGKPEDAEGGQQAEGTG